MKEARLKTHIIKCREKETESEEEKESEDVGTLTPYAIAFIMMMYVIKYQLISIIKRRDSFVFPFRDSLVALSEVINTQYPSVILLSTTRKCDNRIMITFHHHFKVPSSFFSTLGFFFIASNR